MLHETMTIISYDGIEIVQKYAWTILMQFCSLHRVWTYTKFSPSAKIHLTYPFGIRNTKQKVDKNILICKRTKRWITELRDSATIKDPINLLLEMA